MIWFTPYTLDDLQQIGRLDGLSRNIGFEMLEVGDDFLMGRIPVDERTKQPFGILHGGASCVLSETLASIAAWMCINPDQRRAVGLEINANHIRSATEGWITGTCRPVHTGRSTHVWQTEMINDAGKITCVSRMTVAIIDKPVT